MDQFEHAMLAGGIPIEAIHLVKYSPAWNGEFQRYTPQHVEALIYLFPKIYHTLITTAKEIENAKKNYVPMDTSA